MLETKCDDITALLFSVLKTVEHLGLLRVTLKLKFQFQSSRRPFNSNIMSFGPIQITDVNNKGCISLGLLIQSLVVFLVQLIRSKCRLLQFNHTALRIN